MTSTRSTHCDILEEDYKERLIFVFRKYGLYIEKIEHCDYSKVIILKRVKIVDSKQ